MRAKGLDIDSRWLLAGLVSGGSLAPFLEPSCLYALAACVFFLLGVGVRTTPRAVWFIPAGLFFLGLFLVHSHLSPGMDAGDIRRFCSSEAVSLSGVVQSVKARPLGGASMDIASRHVESGSIGVDTHGGVRVFIKEGMPAVRMGDAVKVFTRLRVPERFGTPGEYDFPRHLAHEGICATASIERANGVLLANRSPGVSMQGRVERWRFEAGRLIDLSTPETQRGLVRALAIGDKSAIADTQRRILSASGTSHLFSISGLHLGIIAAFFYGIGRVLYSRSETLLLMAPPRRVLPFVLLPFLALYLALTGGAIPTQRAFIMAALAALSCMGSRRVEPVRLLASVAFVYLLFSPLSLFEPSFQLSFAGVLGILLLVPRLSARFGLTLRPVYLKWPLMLALTTFSATLFTAPLVVLYFHLLAPAGILINLIAVPVVGFVAIPLALLGTVLAPWSPVVAALCFSGCGNLVERVVWMAEKTVSLRLFGGVPLFLSSAQIFALTLLVASVLLPWRRWTPWLVRGLLAGAVILVFRPVADGSQLTLTVLSVGQGESLLVSLPQNRHFLIDGGGLYGETFDVGERLVLPALARLGIPELDAVILTHAHPDHYEGLCAVLSMFPVRSFQSAIPEEELPEALRKALEMGKVPAERLPEGWTHLIPQPPGSLDLLVPPQSGALNDRSIACICRYGDDSLLLTGDLESAGVVRLLGSLPDDHVGVLKLPHHGSRHSLPDVLCDRLHPRFVFTSSGRDNGYGFPHKSVVQTVRERGIPFYRTDWNGSLQFASRGDGWHVTQWRHGLFR